MKKHLCMAVAACGLLSLASCSEDENVIINDQPVVEDGAQEIVLQVANAGDGLTTRGGRPLSSSDAAQNIDEVKIVILNEQNQIVAVHTIDDWMNISNLYTTDGHGQQYSWKLSKDEMISQAGEYKAYAVGYTNPESSYSLVVADATQGSTAADLGFLTIDQGDKGTGLGWVNASIASLTSENGGLGEEIFAGEIDINVNSDGEFEGDNILTLHRQVTGTIGYFTNIPTYKSGTKTAIFGQLKADGSDYEDNKSPKVENSTYQDYVKDLRLRLVISDLNDEILMAGFNSDFRETGENVDFIMNGKKVGSDLTSHTGLKKVKYVDTSNLAELEETDAEGYVVYEIRLGDWFTNGDISDVDVQGFAGNGLLDFNDAEGDNWKTPTGISGNVAYQRGTVFAGEFLLPILKVANQQTLQLQLVSPKALVDKDDTDSYIIGSASTNEDAPAVVRAWDINLPEKDDQIWENYNASQKRHVYRIDEATGVPVEAHENQNEYEEQNDSYSLVRNHLYTVGVISEDENEPADLSTVNSLILRVNDNWEMIHQMEIE